MNGYIEYYRENFQLYTILIFWLIIGMFGGPLIYVVVPMTLFLFRQKDMYEELFIGYLFILILSDSLETRLEFAKNLKNIYALLLALFFFADLKTFAPLNRLYRGFLPFFTFILLTLFLSIGEKFVLVSTAKGFSYVLVFFIVPNYLTKIYRDHGLDFIKRFVFFLITSLLVGLMLKFLAHNVAYIESGRYRGIMGNPNGLGIFALIIFVLFFLLNSFYVGLFSRNERIIGFGLILISILMTDSRNAIIGVLIFYVFQRFFSLSPWLGFVLFVFIVVVFEIISENITTIITALGLGNFLRVSTLETGSGRFIAWKFAWKQIDKNFFIGPGFSYNEYYMRQHYKELGKLGHQGGIHNSYLSFWMDQGLIGLLIYLRSYILLFIKAAKNTRFAFPIMFSFSFTAIFESWLVGSLSAYAFLAMAVFTFIASDEFQNEEESEKQSAKAVVISE